MKAELSLPYSGFVKLVYGYTKNIYTEVLT